METKPRESAARRKILETAADLFYKNGIRATGIDTIIGAADVARMTLYKHFPTKDALVEAVLRETATCNRNQWEGVIGDESLAPSERILAIFDRLGAILLAPEYRGCPFVNAMAETPDPQASVHCAALEYKAVLWQVIGGCVRDLGVPSEEELTEQLILLIDGASVRAQMGFAHQAVPAVKSAARTLIDMAVRDKEPAPHTTRS